MVQVAMSRHGIDLSRCRASRCCDHTFGTTSHQEEAMGIVRLSEGWEIRGPYNCSIKKDFTNHHFGQYPMFRNFESPGRLSEEVFEHGICCVAVD